jgi:hypothetical protein
MRALLRLIGLGRRPAAGGASFYAEAQCAGWMVPPSELGTGEGPAMPQGKEKVEADGLLARFYSSQEC